jgi:hypothetical protein
LMRTFRGEFTGSSKCPLADEAKAGAFAYSDG